MSIARHGIVTLGALLILRVEVAGQVPQPFPRATQSRPAPPRPASQPQAPATPSAGLATLRAEGEGPDAPTEAQLGFPIYPTAQFITSYDAGRGQRFYLFGATAPFSELVAYYRNYLRERGHLVFDLPPTHVFEVGRFREESMAFPAGVTVKDFTWGGSSGYPNPRRGVQPERFATVIQIVPAPTAAPDAPVRR